MTPEQWSTFRKALFDIAHAELGVHEEGVNSGARVQEYQRAVDGIARGESWCMAFVQWCIAGAEKATGMKLKNFLRTEHCLSLGNYAKRIGRMCSTPTTGSVMIMRHGTSTNGHTGIVTATYTDKVDTIEGNTNAAGSREGDCVAAKVRRYDAPISGLHIVGFVDLSLWDVEPLG